MATVIPVQGETEQILVPASLEVIDKLLSRSVPTYRREMWADPVGAVFIFPKTELKFDESLLNPRAFRFMSTRGCPVLLISGTVLYLSSDEWCQLSGQPKRSSGTSSSQQLVPIRGNTFPVKEELKALGGRWDPGNQAWNVPLDRVEEARNLVKNASSKREMEDRKNRRSGYCVKCAAIVPTGSGSVHFSKKVARSVILCAACHKDI